jgi:hypothetical protein
MLLATGTALLHTAAEARAQTLLPTAVTYQGQLKDGGSPANGSHDLQFSLFDAASGGAQVGSTICVDNVNVVDGLFTAQFDFGASVFGGGARWLEIAVRADNTPGNCPGGAYTSLAPRQPLTAAPYALQTRGLFVADSGSVGIGTTAPAFPFHLAGTAQVMQKIVTSNAVGTWLDLENTSTGGKRWGLVSTGLSNGEGAGKMLLRAITDGRTVMTLQGDGNVGIGLTSPQRRVDIAGSAARISSTTGTGPRLELKGPASGISFTMGAVDFVDANDVLHGGIHYTRSIIGDRLWLRAGGEDQVTVDQAGQVGIGTSTPAAKLHIEGGTDTFPTGGGYLVLGSPSSTNVSMDNNEIMARNNGAVATLALNPDGGHVSVSASSTTGNLGIGTAFPNVRLHINGGTDASLGGGGSIVIGDPFAANLAFDENEIMARSAGVGTNLLLNREGGDVLIGSASGGTSVLSAPIIQITGGADLSENFDLTTDDQAPAQPGTVVCIDPKNPGKLTPCTKPYERTVAGVISGAGGVRPGMVMGQRGTIADGAHPVALSGRVWAYCDAFNVAIEPGDLLTTSETPGHAMKVSDFPLAQGAIIGKAMSGLAKGESGLVLVLVNLH